MKYLSILFMICVCCTVSFAQQQQKHNASETTLAKKNVKKNAGSQLYLLSKGNTTEEISKEDFEKIQKSEIEYVKVLKDEAVTSIYGDKGKNGVVLIVLKNNNKKIKTRQG